MYAAQRSSDKALTVMVINKTTGDLTSPLSIAGLPASTAAQVYQYGAGQPRRHRRTWPTSASAAAQSTLTFPAYSITELVIPAGRHRPPAALRPRAADRRRT